MHECEEIVRSARQQEIAKNSKGNGRFLRRGFSIHRYFWERSISAPWIFNTSIFWRVVDTRRRFFLFRAPYSIKSLFDHARCSMPTCDDDSTDALEWYGSGEDYDTEEDLDCCRYCAQPASAADLVSPCGCKGSLKFAHHECVQKWISTPKERTSRACEVCGEDWRGDFDIPCDDTYARSAESGDENVLSLLCDAYERVLRGVERPLDRHMMNNLGAHVPGPWRETPRRTWWRRTFGMAA